MKKCKKSRSAFLWFLIGVVVGGGGLAFTVNPMVQALLNSQYSSLLQQCTPVTYRPAAL